MAGWVDTLRKTLGWLSSRFIPDIPGVEFTIPSSEVKYVIPNNLTKYTLPSSLMQFTLREED